MSETPSPGDGGSLRARIAKGAAWIFGAVAVRQALRLVSSIVLTRLLLPDDFGLAVTAGLLLAFVEMCADFGIRQALVQHPEGGTTRFVDVAWTLAFWRSLGVSAVVLGLAWPFASLYQDERLAPLVAMSAALPLLQAACSPGRLAWMRELRQDRLNQLDLVADVARLPLNVLGALATGDATGLVLAGIATELVRIAASYAMAPVRPRLVTDRQATGELLRYGRFVFAASILGFFAVRLDQFFVARFLGMDTAGVYSIALNMTTPIEGIVTSMLAGLLFPYLARFQGEPERIRLRMRQTMTALVVYGAPAAGLAALAMPYVLVLLYDERYQGAAAPCQWLIAAAYFTCIGTALNCPLMATGRPHWGTIATGVRLVVFAVAAWFLGGHGAAGYAAAVAIAAVAFTGALAFVPWTVAKRA